MLKRITSSTSGVGSMRLVLLRSMLMISCCNIRYGLCAYAYNKFSGPVSGEITKISIPVYGNEDDSNFDAGITPTVTDFVAKPDYAFSYGVEDPDTGNSQAHHQSREGDVVHGQYSLIDPDGFLRKVVYTSDPKNGFQATVHYIPLDEMSHPTTNSYENSPAFADIEFPSLAPLSADTPSFPFSQNHELPTDDYLPDTNDDSNHHDFENSETPSAPYSQSHMTMYNAPSGIGNNEPIIIDHRNPNDDTIGDYDATKDPNQLADSLIPKLPSLTGTTKDDDDDDDEQFVQKNRNLISTTTNRYNNNNNNNYPRGLGAGAFDNIIPATEFNKHRHIGDYHRRPAIPPLPIINHKDNEEEFDSNEQAADDDADLIEDDEQEEDDDMP